MPACLAGTAGMFFGSDEVCQVSVPLLLHLFERNKAERGGVDAVAPVGFRKSLSVKDMSQMACADAASDLGPYHAVGTIRVLCDHIFIDRSVEGRPSAAAAELVPAGKERLPGHDVHVDAGGIRFVVFVCKRGSVAPSWVTRYCSGLSFFRMD